MYNKFYGFRENPFSLLPDPDFLFVGREHGAALNLLELAVLNQSGFCVISGEIGAGKTTIVRELLNRLNDQVRVGLITNTHTSFNDLMRWVLAAFDLKMTSTDGVLMHRKFTQFVTEQFKNGKHTLLIIDEAQNLSVAALEQLRMLSNINSGSDLLLQVVLVGQRELREKLARPELEQFAQRISIDYFLKPLSETDTASYISHRVAHAGGKSSLFDQEACAQIYHHCEGVPRVINRLCDLSLVYGYAENAPAISAKLVNAVVTEHKFTKSGMGEDIADPVALKAIPVTNSKKETQESAMITASQKKQNEAAQPIEVKAQPAEVKAQPAEVKAQPAEVKAQAAEVKAQPIEVKKEEIAVVKPAQPNEQPPKQEVSAEPREKPRRVAQVQAAKVEMGVLSAKEAVEQRQKAEQVAEDKTKRAVAAVATAATDLAASRQAEAGKLATEQRLAEVVNADENASQLAVAAKSTVEKAVIERTAAEVDRRAKKNLTELAAAKLNTEKTAAEKRLAEKLSDEEAAIEAALQTAVVAEKALAEKVAAEKAAAEAAAAAETRVREASELRVAMEAETARQLAEVGQKAEFALAEQEQANQMAAEKIASEKMAREQAYACDAAAKEKAAERVEVLKLTEVAATTAKNTQKTTNASRIAAERAVAGQAEAEKEVIACMTTEKIVLASVAAEQAAEALKAAEIADAAKEVALRDAENKKAAAAAAAEFAAKAMAAADKAAGRVGSEAKDTVQSVQTAPRPLTEEPAMKELLLADGPVATAIPPNAEVRHRRKSGRTWAIMAITAIVSGSAWFVVKSGDSANGNDTLLGKAATSSQHSANIAPVETAALEVGKPSQQ